MCFFRKNLYLARMKRGLLTFLGTFYALLLLSQASPIKVWDKRFAGDSVETLNSVRRAADGSLFLAGYSNSKATGEKSATSKGGYDYWIVKTDSNGNKLWDKVIGSTSNDYLMAVWPTSDGGCLLGGYSGGPVSGDKTKAAYGSNDYWVVRLSNNGTKLWDSTYGGTGYEELRYIEPTTDKGFLLVGYTNSVKSGSKKSPGKGAGDVWILKIDSSGRSQWDSTYGGNSDESCYEAHQTKDGGFLIAASSKSPISGNKTVDSIGSYDIWILKISGTGVVQWDKVYGGKLSEDIFTFVELNDGGFLLAGNSYSLASGNKTLGNRGTVDIWLIRTNVAGNKIWERIIGGNSDEKCNIIRKASDNGFILGGYSYSGTGDRSKFNIGGADFWVIKVDSFGKRMWDERFGGLRDDVLTDMELTPGDNMILAGHSKSAKGFDKTADTLNSNYDYWMLKARQPNFIVSKHDTLLCPNDDIYVHYLTTNIFADTNKIYLQISNGYSDFSTPTTLGIKTATKLKADSLLGIIPPTFSGLPYYKFRFISTAPKDTSMWSAAVKILSLPKKPVITRWFDTLYCSNTNGVMYQWLKNNVDIPGATQRKYLVTAPGYYSVRVDSPESCPATSDALAISAIGIQRTADGFTFQATPNPFSNTLSLSFPGDVPVTLQLIDITGKVVYTGMAVQHTTLATSLYAPGVYFLKAESEKGSAVMKLIRQ